MRKSRAGGFTLLELIVVIAIFGVALSIIWPRIPGVGEAERSGALRKLAASETALFEWAALKKKALPSSMNSGSENTGLA